MGSTSVGGTDSSGNRYQDGTNVSAYGPGLTVVAPGENISGPNLSNGTDVNNWTGTSMSAPEVSGAFTSLWYACRALPYAQIKSVIEQTASGNGSWNQYTGYGLFNFGTAANFLLGSGEIYQFINANGVHGWTQNPANQLWPQYEGIACRIAQSQLPGTVPFYSMYNAPSGFRFLTQNPDEGVPIYTNEGIVGYVSPTPNAYPGMSAPLYRYSNPTEGWYMTEADPSSQFGQILAANGYSSNGVYAYVF